MRLSTKGRYGVRALVELALRESGKPVLIREIAAKQDISLSYLERIVSPLINAGLLRSIKGPKGGILLNRKPEDIKLNEVIQLLEGSFAPTDCVDNPDICDRSPECVTRDVWVKLKNVTEDVLGSTTLKELADQQRDKGLPELDSACPVVEL